MESREHKGVEKLEDWKDMGKTRKEGVRGLKIILLKIFKHICLGI